MWYNEYGFKKIPFGWAKWATGVTPKGWRHGYRAAPRAGDRAAPASANIFLTQWLSSCLYSREYNIIFSIWYKGGCGKIRFELATGVALAPRRQGRRLTYIFSWISLVIFMRIYHYVLDVVQRWFKENRIELATGWRQDIGERRGWRQDKGKRRGGANLGLYSQTHKPSNCLYS